MIAIRVAVLVADCQPRRRRSGTITRKETSTPIQPLRMVCTTKVTRPPTMVPNTRAPACDRLWLSLSSSTTTTASRGYQTKAIRSLQVATAAVIRIAIPSLRLLRSS